MATSDGENRDGPSLRTMIERSYDWVERRDKLIALWAGASSWSAEEVVSLAFNASPDSVIKISRGGYDTSRVRLPEPGPHLHMLARRAVADGVLRHPIRPINFIAWAEGVGLEFDDAWHEAVASRASRPGRTSPIDWRFLPKMRQNIPRSRLPMT